MRSLVAAFVLLLVPVATAQEVSYPERMGEVLKKGDTIGIVRNPEAGTLDVTVYSAKVFEIVRDARTLAPGELEERYPQLVSAKQKKVAEFTVTLQSRQGELPRGKAFGTPEARVQSYSRRRLGIVAHVGRDYFVVADGEDAAGGTAYATRYLSSLRWQNEIPFNVSVSYVDSE